MKKLLLLFIAVASVNANPDLNIPAEIMSWFQTSFVDVPHKLEKAKELDSYSPQQSVQSGTSGRSNADRELGEFVPDRTYRQPNQILRRGNTAPTPGMQSQAPKTTRPTIVRANTPSFESPAPKPTRAIIQRANTVPTTGAQSQARKIERPTIQRGKTFPPQTQQTKKPTLERGKTFPQTNKRPPWR